METGMMKNQLKVSVLLSILILTIMLILSGCQSEPKSSLSHPFNSPIDSPAADLFLSDQFDLPVQLPQGWASAEGPEYLAKPFEGKPWE